MTRRGPDDEPLFDFWQYVDNIPREDYCGFDCHEGRVTFVYTSSTGHFEHVLFDSENPDVFMAIVLDLKRNKVHGHYLLNLRKLD